MTDMRVLLTGATGYIASQLLPAFQERYDLRLLDVREEDGSGRRVEGIEVADLLGDDSSKLEQLFANVDVVVHTGHRKPTGTDPQSQYDVERTNVDMMQRVYQLSLETGVHRVVAASTNQAAKWYEQPYFAGLKDRVSAEDYPRPESFYGWAAMRRGLSHKIGDILRCEESPKYRPHRPKGGCLRGFRAVGPIHHYHPKMNCYRPPSQVSSADRSPRNPPFSRSSSSIMVAAVGAAGISCGLP
jgi:hypothetical protein